MATTKRGLNDSSLVKISASCLADAVTAGPNASLASVLRPYKHNKRGQGFIRSVYYRPSFIAIRQYHAKDNSLEVLKVAKFEFQKKHDLSDKQWEKTKCKRNIQAIDAYERRYANRRFVVESNHRLSFRLGSIVVTAAPDLWVTEHGIPVLLKVGLSKKRREFVDVLLTVIRKAAVASGYKVRAKNIVYLDISSGAELICRRSLTGFNQSFRAMASKIAREWPDLGMSDIESSLTQASTAELRKQ